MPSDPALIWVRSLREILIGRNKMPARLRTKDSSRLPFRHSTGLLVTALLIISISHEKTWSFSVPEYNDHAASPEVLITFDRANRLLVQAKESNDHDRPQVKLHQLMQDHNHLMHLFLVRVPGLDSMWHLHPDPIKGKGNIFVQASPAMPAGHYQAFADVVDNQGTAWTLAGDLNVSQPLNQQGPLTGDDSTWSGTPLGTSLRDSATVQLPSGDRIVWRKDMSKPLAAHTPLRLEFEVLDSHSKPVLDLEPYMGMTAHAQIVRSDASVFAHIHASSHTSMPGHAMRHSMTEHGGMTMNMSGTTTQSASPPLSNPVHFLYTFSRSGEYRIFVQVKRAGQVETAAFDLQIQ